MNTILDPKANAQAAEQTGKTLMDKAGEDAPGVFSRLLDVLTGFVLSGQFTLDLRKKPNDRPPEQSH